jgi:hypothetical protein
MQRLFSISVDVAAGPDHVWGVMSGIERWHEWTPSVTRIDKLDPGPLGPGSRARIFQPSLRPAVWTVTSVNGRSFTWATRGPGFVAIGRHLVEPTPGGSRATLSLEFTGILGGLVAWMFRDLNNRYLRLEAEGLKRRSEELST